MKKAPVGTLLSTLAALLVCVIVPVRLAQAQEFEGIRVPDGFRVTRYADDELAHDIFSLTLDSEGRVVVSGPGYIRTLIDTDGDGRADRFEQFSDKPASGAQGMFFHGRRLLCAGDDGLLLFQDDNADGKADGAPQTFLKIAAGGEHHVHSIQKGPDGWWYVIAGNFSGVSAAYATSPSSPVKAPVSGTLLRLTPELRGGEIVADGFRNAYDFAFNEMGDCFTYDSDDERDISLPWYLPTQVFHVLPASNAGYVTPGLKRPPTYPEMPPVVASFGRGSPTGVLCYRHRQFPEAYRGALFVQDWTLGRILVVPLNVQGAGWTSQPFEFAAGQNQFGFAPTDMEVGPDGSLYVSVGGRGTRGSVYRISWDGNSSTPSVSTNDESSVNRVLRAPQPNTAWSRTRWVPEAKKLSPAVFRSAALDASRTVVERVRAVEVLVELHGGMDPETARQLVRSDAVEVRARAAWAIGRTKPAAPDIGSLKPFLRDVDPFVQRAALESLTTVTSADVFSAVIEELAAALSHSDRVVRLTAAQLMQRLEPAQLKAVEKAIADDSRAMLWFYLGRLQRSAALSVPAAQVATAVLQNSEASIGLRRESVRVLQLALGDTGPQKDRPPMFESYAPRLSAEPIERELNPLLIAIADAFPSGDTLLDHELVRFFAMTAPLNRDLFTRILGQLTDESLPQDDLHRLAALSQFELERSVEETSAIAKALVAVDVKLKRLSMKQDTNWDDRIGELYGALCAVDPALPSLIPSQPGFGQPGHVLFLSKVPEALIPQAITGLVNAVAEDADYQWSSDVVFVIGESDDPAHRKLLRNQLSNLSVRDAVLMVLAETPSPADRPAFVAGLESPQLNAVEACLNALKSLPRTREPAELYQLLGTARRLINDKREFQLREMAMRILQNNTEQTLKFVFGETGYQPQPESMQAWQEWLESRYPDYRPVNTSEQALKLLASLNSVAWDSGDQLRGQKLFEKLSCARCHGGRRALGPDLTGVARRFSRNDLFAAIVDPNRDISARYQTTSIETKSGKILSGLIVYESIDGLLLRDAEHRTYRVEAADIDSKSQQRNSLMPEGLLKDCSDQDLADLNRYLQSL